MSTTESIGDEVTTLIIRGIPAGYTQRQLSNEIRDLFPRSNGCDFLYLPWDSSRDRHCGFAFINLADNALAREFASRMHRYRFEDGGRFCTVAAARNQGLRANVHSLITRMLTGAVKSIPVFMSNGCSVDVGQLVEAAKTMQDNALGAEVRFGPLSDVGEQEAGMNDRASLPWSRLERRSHSQESAVQRPEVFEDVYDLGGATDIIDSARVVLEQAGATCWSAARSSTPPKIIAAPDPDETLLIAFVRKFWV